LEYTEILLGKMDDESEMRKIIYRFQTWRADVALRFDLTVPFARFAAQHIGQIGTPFKRYQLGPVWRGREYRPTAVIASSGSAIRHHRHDSNAADIEVALVIHDLMTALGFERFRDSGQQSAVLNGLLEEMGLAGKTKPLLRALDKLAKIGRPAVIEKWSPRPVSRPTSGAGLSLTETRGSTGRFSTGCARLWHNAKALEGIARLREAGLEAVRTAGVPEDKLSLDLSIAAGWITTREPFLRRFSWICRTSAACAQGAYDDWRGFIPNKSCPGWGRR